MLNKLLSLLLTGLFLLMPAARTASAKTQKQDSASSTNQIKVKITKLGVGKKARATITTKSGMKVKGYVYSASDDDFVMRDRQTDAPTTIPYADVAKVHRDGGHSTAKHLGLGVGIGVGGFIAVLLLVFAHLND